MDDSNPHTLHVITRFATESHIQQEQIGRTRFAVCIEEDLKGAVPSHQGIPALFVALDENLDTGNEGILYARHRSTLIVSSFLNTKGVVPLSRISSLGTNADSHYLAVERCTSVLGLCCIG
jgi:hypothetical protein